MHNIVILIKKTKNWKLQMQNKNENKKTVIYILIKKKIWLLKKINHIQSHKEKKMIEQANL